MSDIGVGNAKKRLWSEMRIKTLSPYGLDVDQPSRHITNGARFVTYIKSVARNMNQKEGLTGKLH